MRPRAIVARTPDRGAIGDHLASLLRHWGVGVKRVSLSDLAVLSEDAIHGDSGRTLPLLAIDATEAARHPGTVKALFAQEGVLGDVLLYDVSPGAQTDRLLRSLSGGVLRGVGRLEHETHAYEIPEELAEIAGSLAGSTIGPVQASHDFAIDCAEDDARAETLIRADGRPLFVRVARGNGHLYVLGTDEVLDLDEPVERLDDAERFSVFVPVVMLIRALYSDTVWHANAAYASFVIDDPLLTPRYGHLDYARFVGEMDASDFATSIAFIPVNERRTWSDTARLFRRRADRLSICVHGCDHTKAEFGVGDAGRLRNAAATARARMESHRRRYDVEYDDVMVFPQGVFSSAAMEALADEGYAAAANSGPKAVDDPEGLVNGDFLDVAIRRYGDLSLFLRRTLDDPGFAFDTFLGRPALVVSHPADLGGHDRIRRVVGGLNDAGVRWGGLGRIGRELHVRRRVAPGRYHVLASSPRLVLVNESSEDRTCLVAVKADPRRQVSSVETSGGKLPFRRLGDHVFFEVELSPEADERVEVAFAPGQPGIPLRAGLTEQTRVIVRRRLSELRDAFLAGKPHAHESIRRPAGHA